MKIIRKDEAPKDNRPDGRIVTTLHELQLEEKVDSSILYHCFVPGGKFGAHYHSKSHEFIWFPVGGMITVNGETCKMEKWDGVLLYPGDVHGYEGNDCGDIIHFAVRMPGGEDKVSVNL